MSARRLLELWAPPPGYRLASAIATSYELQADFLEEDLLPVALDLRLPSARGRDFRLELERALQDAEVTVFFHPARYQAGLRRTPRIDLVPLPEGRYPKLHAKVALLRFVLPSSPEPHRQVVRLVVGSANLTNAGYRTNIEVCAALDDTPDAEPALSTAVRDAAEWLEGLVGESTAQVARQFRDLRAVFAARPVPRNTEGLQFVGLPAPGGFPTLAAPGDRVSRVTISSPFWPTGDDLSDFASSLRRLCGGGLGTVRLLAPAVQDEEGAVHPVLPAALVRALWKEGATVEVAAADPRHGCGAVQEEDDGEFDDIGDRRGAKVDGRRALHAKAILVEGSEQTQLAIGSFNLTRKGLGLVPRGNAEAGLMWTVASSDAARLAGVLAFGTAWRKVKDSPEDWVREPESIDGEDDGAWPTFLISLKASRSQVVLEGDAREWPEHVVIRMRDIRSRLHSRDEWFDDWIVQPPPAAQELFHATMPLRASWLASLPAAEAEGWQALPNLEAEVSWGEFTAIVPIVFEDKHLFPVVEVSTQEDEQSLIAWFLGLRVAGEAEDGGFGHSIDPVTRAAQTKSPTNDILSYLVRDFVHALPGIRNRLAEAGLTETGLRTALMGPRSPVELAREVRRAWREPQPGRPRKTPVASIFQLVELQRLLESVPLPPLAEGATEALREEAVQEVRGLLQQCIGELKGKEERSVLQAYLKGLGGVK